MNREQNKPTEKMMADESEATLELFSERLDAATPCGEKHREDAHASEGRAGRAMRNDSSGERSPKAAERIDEAVTAAANRARTKGRG